MLPFNGTPTIVPALRVFLAEDDVEMRRLIATALRRDGHFVLEAPDGLGLLMDLGHAFWGDQEDRGIRSVIISDIRMPGRDGLEILRGICRMHWCPPVILITAFGDRGLHAHAAALGAHAVLDKPFDLAALRDLVARIATAEGPATPAAATEGRASSRTVARGK
jgi:CheY-like chemotaxis protein